MPRFTVPRVAHCSTGGLPPERRGGSLCRGHHLSGEWPPALSPGPSRLRYHDQEAAITATQAWILVLAVCIIALAHLISLFRGA